MADAAPTPLAPIIIKRIKKGGHGHHGGAWKVAYADFVTAMMAFFLLLWLINVTSPEQKMGLAEYFMPTIGIKDAQGIGFKGGKKPSSKPGRSTEETTAPGIVIGQMPQGPVPQAPDTTQVKPDPDAKDTSADQKAKEDTSTKDTTDLEAFKTTSEEIKQALRQDQDIENYQNNVIVEDTPEGLKIDMIDDAKKPMFIPGTATLTEMGKKVIDSMSTIVLKTPNNIILKGNTDASGATANPQYTNWELSADRANAARRFLITTQLEPERIMKVMGVADRELLTPAEPNSPRNRRVTLILMRGSYFRDPKAAATARAIISVSDPKPAKMETKKPPIEVKKPENSPTSIFNPTINTDQPGIEIKEPEARPELNLPSPKTAAPAPKPQPQKKGPSDGASIFNPEAPVEKILPLKENDERPELNLDKPKAPAKKPAASEPDEDIDEGAGLTPSIYERSPSAQGMNALTPTLKLH